MSAATTGASRIAPAQPPYHPDIAARFDALMPPGSRRSSSSARSPATSG